MNLWLNSSGCLHIQSPKNAPDSGPEAWEIKNSRPIIYSVILTKETTTTHLFVCLLGNSFSNIFHTIRGGGVWVSLVPYFEHINTEVLGSKSRIWEKMQSLGVWSDLTSCLNSKKLRKIWNGIHLRELSLRQGNPVLHQMYILWHGTSGSGIIISSHRLWPTSSLI